MTEAAGSAPLLRVQILHKLAVFAVARGMAALPPSESVVVEVSTLLGRCGGIADVVNTCEHGFDCVEL